MKNNANFFLIITLISMGYFSMAQNLVPIKLDIEKEIPGETFSQKSLRLTFWVQEPNKFIGLDTTNTKMFKFEDDVGTDLLEAHHQAISEYEIEQAENVMYGNNYINNRDIIDFENSRALNDAIGFELSLYSLALPAENTKVIHIKALIAYFIEDASVAEQSTVVKGFIPDSEIADWQGKSISIIKNGSSSYDENDEEYIGHSILNADIGVAVKEIDIIDDSGNIIQNLGYIYMEQGQLNFYISKKQLSSPLNLKFTYTPLKSVSFSIDERISIGL